MSVIIEGDLIRPLGFVTLYFAYAEAELDLLIKDLIRALPNHKYRQNDSVGVKLNLAIKVLRKLPDDSLHDLKEKLKAGRALFERRNTIIHSCIFSGGRMISNRDNVPKEYISDKDLINLSNEIFTWKDLINVNRCKYLIPILEDLANEALE